jgi:predicted metal-dependent hydrolase
VGDLRVAVRPSAKRRSTEIVIERDGSLSLLAPVAANEQQLAKFVRDKRMWIYRKLSERQLLARHTAGKEFVTGEGFAYLGRNYRLRMVECQDRPLKLLNGRFLLMRSAQFKGRDHFIRWYEDHGRIWLRERVDIWANRMAVVPGAVNVRNLGSRWGSCGKGNRLNFHWALMTLPRNVIDYIIVHELAHIEAPAHDQKFWRTVERAMPDYRQRKSWLDQFGGQFADL